MLVIQIIAAALLLLGSWLIFRALIEIDAPTWPQPLVRPRPRHYDLRTDDSDVDLPRAA